MAVLHLNRRHTEAERELDAVVARGEARCREMEARLEVLGAHIAETRRMATAAGILERRLPCAPVREPEPVQRRRRRPVPARLRLAAARAISRTV